MSSTTEQSYNKAATHLATSGRIVVLSPPHQSLFTPFDKAIGHHRRYNRKTLMRATPENLETVETFYLDCVGLLASAGNRLVLKAAMPTASQLRLWDTWMVPLSRAVDPLRGYRLGKSIVGIWKRKQ